MKTLEIKHLLYILLAAITLGLSSCSSENEEPANFNKLPQAIAQDFRNRCASNTIKGVYSGDDFDRESNQQETYIYTENQEGEECTVVYLDNVWNRTIQKLSNIDQLPYQVLLLLLKVNPEARENEFQRIEEVSQNCINGKYYLLSYLQDTPSLKNLVHTLVISSDGTVLKSCTYDISPNIYVHPLSTDMDWITKHYKDAVILAYVCDLGDDNYLILHNGIIKSVLFRKSGSGTEWKETSYPLSQDMTIPNNVLESLHTTYPNFYYTEVKFIENQGGEYYLFVDGSRSDRLGYYIATNQI